MVQMKQRIQSNFPRYNQNEEDCTHVLQCQSEDICIFRSDLLIELKIWIH